MSFRLSCTVINDSSYLSFMLFIKAQRNVLNHKIMGTNAKLATRLTSTGIIMDVHNLPWVEFGNILSKSTLDHTEFIPVTVQIQQILFFPFQSLYTHLR